MTEAPRLLIPNSYQTPNWLVDTVMRLLTGNEWKCIDVICRKTFGWQKRSDRIAKSQIMDLTGLGDDAIDTSMSNLVRFGLVVRVAENDVANRGVEWALQVDDDKINWGELSKRKTERTQGNVSRTQKARMVKGGGVVEHPPLVEQPGGGVVQQPPQNPLSKPNKKEEEEAPKIEFSQELQEKLTAAGVYRRLWPEIQSRLSQGWTEADVLAVLDWMRDTNHDATRAAQRFVARIREGSKAPDKYYPLVETDDQDPEHPEPAAEVDDLPLMASDLDQPIHADSQMTPIMAWQSVLGQLSAEMSKASFDVWVKDTSVIDYHDGKFLVAVENDQAKSWLESRLTSTVQRILTGICNLPQVTVEFVVLVSTETVRN